MSEEERLKGRLIEIQEVGELKAYLKLKGLRECIDRLDGEEKDIFAQLRTAWSIPDHLVKRLEGLKTRRAEAYSCRQALLDQLWDSLS